MSEPTTAPAGRPAGTDDLPDGLVQGDDGVVRCWWTGDHVDYRAYHDEQWGRPVVDDRALLEKLALEAFQAGLSWLTVLRRRETLRAAFDGFDPGAVARYGDADVERLLADPGIIRHRGKVEAVVAQARAYPAVVAEHGSLAALVWAHEADRPEAPRTSTDVDASTPRSTALARELKRLGMRFVGPTTVHALLQACGVVTDHLVGCHARQRCLDERDALRRRSHPVASSRRTGR